MDLQKLMLSGHPTGFSKPRAKTVRKPCSAASLREFVSSFRPSDLLDEDKHESIDSYTLLHGVETEGVAYHTNAASITSAAFKFSEENSHLLRHKQSVEGQEYRSNLHGRGKQNNSSQGFSSQEEIQFRTSCQKQGEPDTNPYHPGGERSGKANSNGSSCVGGLEGKRSERYVKELLNRDMNQESGSRGRVEVLAAKAKAETHDTTREDNSAPTGRRSILGTKDIPSEVPLQVEGRPTKLKLKVGGVTHTLETFLPAQKVDSKKFFEVIGNSEPESKKRRQRLILQGTSDDEDADIRPADHFQQSSRMQQSNVLTISNSEKKREDAGACKRLASLSEQVGVPRHVSTSPSSLPLRKSSRVVKRRVFDVEGEDDLETEKKSKKKSKKNEDELYKEEDDEIAASDERETSNDADLNAFFDDKYSSRKSLQNIYGQNSKSGGKRKKGAPLTAQQRALQSCKEHNVDTGMSLIEFPNGLPSAAPRKQKVELTEEEIQAKKAEAARRRKQQIGKAARDIQESAIQKILSQDSARKKREGQLQKQREEMAQNKKAVQLEAASNSMRYIFGPSGTILSWSKDLELPSLFQSGPCSYPAPREKCAVPTCNNTYKYRHSKLKLPLCSLECYRTVETPNKTGTAC